MQVAANFFSGIDGRQAGLGSLPPLIVIHGPSGPSEPLDSAVKGSFKQWLLGRPSFNKWISKVMSLDVV